MIWAEMGREGLLCGQSVLSLRLRQWQLLGSIETMTRTTPQTGQLGKPGLRWPLHNAHLQSCMLPIYIGQTPLLKLRELR
ncbi:hypothetical protein BC777_2647 [Yoonia maricola]|uniref:Uncharacterized protein n=1 Tax=Yoonia maricola TaxID=420999 RepID=A0A2M8W5T9_9RHOB|nr:hypothetical protein BC777_2647 [Yoonia maricola]